ncbi:hypothetical protein [Vibrio sp. THAF190c]|uniref:hypothetical protein n=1 Tax=Vibrio sp. THAF190c TaxID=2587865 RepID=UPI001268AC41|nr:hypothetical protein [Vibrio sp. THAF190c]QFT13314.1 hypothetical protein FIV04_25525 [Vibrio sp. THAF190c]
MCNDKSKELVEANEKLSDLLKDMQSAKSSFDDAIDHSNDYFGDDERIENHRDSMAEEAYKSYLRCEKAVDEQIQYMATLVKE